jgi:hypothetical protein
MPSHHTTLAGLAERREANLKARRELQSLRLIRAGRARLSKDECKARNRALVYFATLPTNQLTTVYKAAVQQFSR